MSTIETKLGAGFQQILQNTEVTAGGAISTTAVSEAEQDLEGAAKFWAEQPGFEGASALLDKENKLDEDNLWENKLFVEQAQQFLIYREGYYKDGEVDLSDASLSDKNLLTTPYELLTEKQKEKLADKAVSEAGWIGNNTGSMTKAFAQLTGDNVPAAQKQAALFMMDVTDNLSFKKNWGSKTWRFVSQGIVTDPLTVGSVALGLVTFGTGTVAAQAGIQGGKLAAVQALRTAVKSAAASTIKSQFGRVVAGSAAISAVESGAFTHMEQKIKTSEYTNDAGETVQRQAEYSTANTAISATFGGVFGAAFPVGIKYAGKGINKLKVKFGSSTDNAANDAAATVDAPKVDEKPQAKAEAETKGPEAETKGPEAETKGPEAETKGSEAETKGAADNSKKDSDNVWGEDKLAKFIDALGEEDKKQFKLIMSFIVRSEYKDDFQVLARNPVISSFEDFLVKHQKEYGGKRVSDLSDDLLKALTNKEHVVSSIQQEAFRRQVADSILHNDVKFNFDRTLSKYEGLEKSSPEFVENLHNMRRDFIQNYDSNLTGMEKKYAELKNSSDTLTRDEKAFVAACDESFQDGKFPRDEFGQSTLSKGQFKEINSVYSDIHRAELKELGISIPKLDTSISGRVMGTFLAIQNPRTTPLNQALRVTKQNLDVDGLSNMQNGVKAVGEILGAEGLSKKLLELDQKIKSQADNNIALEEIKKNIRADMRKFVEANDGALARASERLSFFQREIEGWETIDKGRFRKGVTKEQKDALKSYVSFVKDMTDNLQIDKKGEEFGPLASHLTHAKNKEEIRWTLNSVEKVAQESIWHRDIGKITFEKDPEKKNGFLPQRMHKIQERDSLPRMLSEGYFLKERRETGSMVAKDPGNLESTFDVGFVDTAERMMNKTWSTSDDNKASRDMADFVDANMADGLVHAMKYLRRKVGAEDSDRFRSSSATGLLKNLEGGDAYSREVAEVLREISSPSNRKAGGTPPLFGIQYLGDGFGGVRRVQNIVNDATFLWDLRTRYADYHLVGSGPFRAITSGKVSDQIRNGLKYLGGYVKTVDEEGNTVYKLGDSSLRTGLMGVDNIPVVNKLTDPILGLYNSTPGLLLRVPLRVAFAPEKLVWEGSKVVVGSVGNTAAVVGAGLGVLGATDLALDASGWEWYQNNISRFGVRSWTIDAGLAVADTVGNAVIETGKVKADFLSGGNETAYSVLTLGGAPEWAFDSVIDNASYIMDNRVDTTGEFSPYENLLNFRQDFDLEAKFKEFNEEFGAIDAQIENAEGHLKTSLIMLREKMPSIKEHYDLVQENRKTAEGALLKATSAYEVKAQLKDVKRSEEDDEVYRAELAKLEGAKDLAQDKKDQAEEIAQRFNNDLEVILYSASNIAKRQDEILEYQEKLEGDLSPKDRDDYEEKLEDATAAITKHIKYRTNSIHRVGGVSDKKANEVTEEATKEKTNETAKETKETTDTPVKPVDLNNISTPFTRSQATPSSTTPTRTAPQQRNSGQPQAQDNSLLNLDSLSDTVRQTSSNLFGAGAVNDVTGVAKKSGSFLTDMFGFVSNSQSSWVGIGLAALGGLLTANLVKGGGGFTNILKFAAGAFAVWAGWKHYQGGKTVENERSLDDEYRRAIPGSSVPLMGQTSGHFPANDPRFSSVSTTTVDQNGMNMGSSQSYDALIGGQGSGQFADVAVVANVSPLGADSSAVTLERIDHEAANDPQVSTTLGRDGPELTQLNLEMVS